MFPFNWGKVVSFQRDATQRDSNRNKTEEKRKINGKTN